MVSDVSAHDGAESMMEQSRKEGSRERDTRLSPFSPFITSEPPAYEG
jgi:hypothetical protein